MGNSEVKCHLHFISFYLRLFKSLLFVNLFQASVRNRLGPLSPWERIMNSNDNKELSDGFPYPLGNENYKCLRSKLPT